jgi:hypothetical protein
LGGTTTNPKRDLSNPLKEYGDIQVTEKKKKELIDIYLLKFFQALKLLLLLLDC